MGFFGPRKVSAHDAATRFIMEVLQNSARNWPAAREDLRPLLVESLRRRPSLLDEEWTAYYFGLARLAAEMQAVRNLLPADVAERVVVATCGILRVMGDDGDASVNFVRTLDERWRASLAASENPLHVIGQSLFEALELDEVIDVCGEFVVNPLVLSLLSGVPIRMGMGWWKSFLAANRVV